VEDHFAFVGGVGVTLDNLVASLPADAYYLSPGGRRSLVAAALIAGVPRGARALDVGCGLGPAAIDLAESFACRVAAFDDYEPYLDIGQAIATERGVGSLVAFRRLVDREPLSEYRQGAYDVVLGLGGSLSETIPGGLQAGLAAAAAWLSVGGVVICGDLIASASPSPLIEAVYADKLRTEPDYFDVFDEFGFDVVYASRATRADWDQLRLTYDVMRRRGIELRPPENETLDRILNAAAIHPEVAFLNVVARRRTE
jgi:SAM-dependent methyltransferase